MRHALWIILFLLGAHLALAAVDAGTVFRETATFTATGGEELYRENCQGCHMPKGEGVRSGAGMYPALAKNPNVSLPDFTAYIIMHGLRGMPSFAPDLSDEQISAVSGYVSDNFGNKSAGSIDAAGVKSLRPETALGYIDY